MVTKEYRVVSGVFMSNHRGSFKQYIQFLPAVPEPGPLAPTAQGETPDPAALDAGPDGPSSAEGRETGFDREPRVPPDIDIEPPPRQAPHVVDLTAAAAAARAGRSARRLAFAASLLAAAAIGALGTVLALPHVTPPTDNVALAQTVGELKADLAALKGATDGLARDSRSATDRLGQRLDRAEKGQAEAAARLGKLESVPKAANAAPSPGFWADVTGSVTPRGEAPPAPRPPVLDGWAIREAGPGVAVIEHRGQGLFEVVPGMRIPGIGRIEAIERRDGRLVIVTQRGLIVAPR